MISILNKADCCGCEACVQKCPKQCILLVEDNEGFLYPYVNKEICIDCGLCEKVCPVINKGEKHVPLAVYAAKNKDKEVRIKSSSGGIFSLLAEQVLQESGVIFGARFNEDWEVIHDYTEKLGDIDIFRRSKYVQSRIGNTYKEAEAFLKQERKVLFVGTPCQIKGLKLFLSREYDNLLAVDFICHGVPSPKVWRMYLEEAITNKKAVTNINFRDKITGWNKFSVTISAQEHRGIDFSLLSSTFSKNIFMRAFLSDLILRPSCYQCSSKLGKSGSDITIADYWGIQQVLPDFDDDKGVGLVLINTQKGKEYYSSMQVESIETSYSDAEKHNGGFHEVINIPQKRAEFFHKIDESSLSSLILKTLRPSLIKRVKAQIKRIVTKYR